MAQKNTSNKLSDRITSYFYLIINTISWGAALIVVKPSLEVTTPFRFLLYRFLLAMILSLPILLHYWPKVKYKFKKIKTIFGIEIFSTVGALALLYIGLERTTAIEASLIATTTPIFVVIAGAWYLKEKVETHEKLGLLTAFSGTLLLTLTPIIMNGGSLVGLSFAGNLLVIGHNSLTAIAMVLAKKYYKKIPKLFVASVSFYLGTVAFLFLSLAEVGFSISILGTAVLTDFASIPVWFAAVYMALFGSIIGYTAYIKGQDGIEASEASLFWYLQPLVFIPAGMIFLGERVYSLEIVAMIVVIVGVLIAERRVNRKSAKKTEVDRATK
jgi:drug/metabolite transporter (DMT)-like permease